MRTKGLVLVFSTAIISGFAIFINKFGVSVINPYILTGLKNLIVGIFICAILILMKDRKLLKELSKKYWALLVLIGLIGGSIPFLLFFKGLSLTTGAQGSFIHKTMFIYIALLAVTFLKEKINKKFLFGGLLLLLGNALLLKFIPHSLGFGDLLILIAALFWAAESIISKYILRELPVRIVMWGRMFFGSIFILIFLVFTGQLSLITSLNITQISWVIVTSIILLGYVATWYTGLKHIPVSLAAPVLLLGSPITTLLSFIQTGVISQNQIFGILCVLIGIVIIWKFSAIKKEKLCQELG